MLDEPAGLVLYQVVLVEYVLFFFYLYWEMYVMFFAPSNGQSYGEPD
jgi:hypothetical protein